MNLKELSLTSQWRKVRTGKSRAGKTDFAGQWQEMEAAEARAVRMEEENRGQHVEEV